MQGSAVTAPARQAGWHILFSGQIIISGPGGSRVEPYRAIIAWHRSAGFTTGSIWRVITFLIQLVLFF
jgi:hypothetical protein